MRFKLKIADNSSGLYQTETYADGEFSGGGLSLSYTFDGADYSLRAEERKVVSTRGGDSPMSMEFVQGEHTECVIGQGDLLGSLRIYTHELKILLSPNGCSIFMKYECEGAENGAISRKITAFAVN